MAIGTLKNVRIFSGGTDYTGRTNKIEVSVETEEKDATTFADVDANGDVWKAVRAGVDSGKIAASGLWEADTGFGVDETSWAALGGLSAWTVLPAGAAVGNPAYMATLNNAAYKALGGQNDLAPWEASGSTNTPMARGKVLTLPGTPITATGLGTAIDFGQAWPAGKTMWATLHVLGVSGTTPSATFRVETATDLAFTTPTTRITFNAATARGGQVLSTTAVIPNQFVRAAWTVSGTTPSFLAVVSVGIANS